MNIDLVLAFAEKDRNPAEALEELEPVVAANKPSVLMFNEFGFTLVDVVQAKETIEAFAAKHECDVLTAPILNAEHYGKPMATYRGETRAFLEAAGIAVEPGRSFAEPTPGNIENPNGMENIDNALGVWFGYDHQTYSFPKEAFNGALHVLPGRKMGVSICSELGIVTSNDVKDIDVLLHPSATGTKTFRYSPARTNLLKNHNLDAAMELHKKLHPNTSSSDAEIENNIQVEPGYSIFGNVSSVPVVKCDRPGNSGLISFPSRVSVVKYEHTDKYLVLGLETAK